MRTITIISTRGQQMKKYESAARTWGELTSEIGGDYDLSGLKAVENINKTTLENVDSVLPEGPHRIFLRPEKTKSGIDFSEMSFADLRKNYVQDKPEVILFLMNMFEKNWTRMGTAELREGLTAYHRQLEEAGEAEMAESITESSVDLDKINSLCERYKGEVEKLHEDGEMDYLTAEYVREMFENIQDHLKGEGEEEEFSTSSREKTPEEIELEEAMAEFEEIEEGRIG